MADFSARVPVEPAKIGDYLHDMSNRPEAPKLNAARLLAPWGGWILGVMLGFGLCVVAVETRNGWEEHRDWVVPLAVQGAMIGGLALGHLLYRGKMKLVAPAFSFLVLAALFCAFNFWRGLIVGDGPDDARKALGIITTVLLVVGIITAIVSLIVAEATDPTRAPEPAAE